jgi:hypothetical protein
MAAPFVIDPATGRIRFPDLNLEIGPQMPEAEFIAATARLNRDNLGANDGWQRYSLRTLISDDRKLGLFVIFLNGQLSKASFGYCSKDATWDNWSEERDAAERREYQQQLDAQLGGRSTFSWGRISVLADSKSGGIEIWTDYSKQVRT